MTRCDSTCLQETNFEKTSREADSRRSSSELVIRVVFETLGVHRLEARTAVRNGRGISALRKVGAVQEAVLQKSFLRNGEYFDQVLYTILDEDWRRLRRAGNKFNAPHQCATPGSTDFSISTGLAGSADHSLHEPGNSRAPRSPACSSASKLWHAVTPDPQ